jgi:phenylalanyl-tRNA synthetase alpha chain
MSNDILSNGLQSIAAATSVKALEDLRIHILGKSGALTAELKELGKLSPEERKEKGASLNRIKEEITAALEAKKSTLEVAEMNERLAKEAVDITLPAAPSLSGSIHPITQVTEELTAIFADFGFSVAEGPEIEDDFHNFSALNIPESHPCTTNA